MAAFGEPVQGSPPPSDKAERPSKPPQARRAIDSRSFRRSKEPPRARRGRETPARRRTGRPNRPGRQPGSLPADRGSGSAGPGEAAPGQHSYVNVRGTAGGASRPRTEEVDPGGVPVEALLDNPANLGQVESIRWHRHYVTIAPERIPACQPASPAANCWPASLPDRSFKPRGARTFAGRTFFSC